MELIFSLLKAFFVGGFICFVGQFLLNKTPLVPAKILVIYVVLGVFLGAIGIYKPILKFAGAGASVPLTGFGYMLCKGVRKAVEQDGFIGIFKGGFSTCAVGVSAAIFCGLIVALIFQSRGR